MTTSREQFESAWDEMTGSREGRCKQLRAGIGYRNTPAQEAWQVWQASRAAIVVEIPEPFKLAKSSTGLTYYYADEVDSTLRAAGITVKGEEQ
ncbi:hypothetical protein [Dryocola clanedunensis]